MIDRPRPDESLTRWLHHDDDCPGGSGCTCGLTVAALRESEAWFEVSSALRAAAFLERRGEMEQA